MGFQGSMPLGFRREMAGVRNAQLELAKEQAKLQEGELELSHQLAYAIRDLETNHVLSQTDFNRRIAAAAAGRSRGRRPTKPTPSRSTFS